MSKQVILFLVIFLHYRQPKSRIAILYNEIAHVQ